MFYHSPHVKAVHRLVGLCARRMHRRALAAIEQAELDSRCVDGFAHLSAEGVDFAGHLTFRDAANRRIAGHASDSRQIGGDEKTMKPASGNGQRRFTASMASADNYDIVHENEIVSRETSNGRQCKILQTNVHQLMQSI